MRKYLDYYKRLSDPVKASIWFTISTALQRGITLLTMPIFTRLLTAEQYGMYSVYRSWYDILAIFGTLNIYNACYSKGLLKFENNQYGFTSALQELMTLFTGILFVVYCSNISFWNSILGLSTVYVIAMFIEMFFVPAYSLWCMKERFDYRYKKVIVTTLFISVATPLIGIIAVTSTVYKAEARVLSYVFVQLLVAIPFYAYNLVKGTTIYNKAFWSYALVFSIPLLPHYLSAFALNQSDRLMINSMVGTGEAAIYSIAYTISSMVSIITNAIQNSFMPYTYKAIRNKKVENVSTSAIELCIMVAGLCAAAMLLGPEIIRIFASPEYYEAIWIIPPVAGSIFFTFLYNVFVNVELYYEKTGTVTIVTCIGAGCNLLLNYYFIQSFGYIAAGYTTLICYVFFAFAHAKIVSKVLKRNYGKTKGFDYRTLFFLSIIVLAFVIVTTISYNYLALRVLILVSLLLVCIMKKKWIIALLKNLKS